MRHTLVGIVAHRNETTNADICAAWCELGLDAAVLTPDAALDELRAGDVALLRIDVSRALDTCESGLEVAPDLRRAGVRVLNAPVALLAAHDKLWTEQLLAKAGLPRPAHAHVLYARDEVLFPPPNVVKPRHGSWGEDEVRCGTRAELRACLDEVGARPWFRSHGAFVQELLEAGGRDLRALVAGGRVVGSASRVAAPGEWRTNVAKGARLEPAGIDGEQRRLAVAAVAAVRGDLMAVDLVHTPAGDVVLEVNGTPDFDACYGDSVYADIAAALGLAEGRAARRAHGRQAVSSGTAAGGGY